MHSTKSMPKHVDYRPLRSPSTNRPQHCPQSRRGSRNYPLIHRFRLSGSARAQTMRMVGHMNAPNRPMTSTIANAGTARHTTVSPSVPPVLFTKDLPGPLSLSRLETFGTIRKFDESAGYWNEHANTLYGRAMIVSTVAPFGTVACALTAAWVWLGGPDFPRTIDVISTSHFRSTSAGRRIRVFRRVTSPEHIIRLGNLPVTTPQRTACDLVMGMDDAPDPSAINTLVCRLMTAYSFRASECLQIIKEHRHHKHAGRARIFFESLQRESEPALGQCA